MKALKEIGQAVGVLVIAAVIMAGVAGLIYLDYTAYKERFPHASGWTYFFQGR